MKAIAVADINGPGGDAPGAIEFRPAEGPVEGIAFRCPSGCGEEGWLPVRPFGAPREDTPEWEFNGDRAAPVLRPSVYNTGLPCRWHGFLGGSDGSRPGEWVSC